MSLTVSGVYSGWSVSLSSEQWVCEEGHSRLLLCQAELIRSGWTWTQTTTGHGHEGAGKREVTERALFDYHLSEHHGAVDQWSTSLCVIQCDTAMHYCIHTPPICHIKHIIVAVTTNSSSFLSSKIYFVFFLSLWHYFSKFYSIQLTFAID